MFTRDLQYLTVGDAKRLVVNTAPAEHGPAVECSIAKSDDPDGFIPQELAPATNPIGAVIPYSSEVESGLVILDHGYVG